MKQEEKEANRLVELFKEYAHSHWDEKKGFDMESLNRNAIIYTLITIDDIIKNSPSLPILSDNETYDSDIEENTKFYAKIKQILEDKLK